jgi:predicted transcriptional regulator of viral defense system
MLQDSWDNAAREYVPRKRNSKNAEAYRQLPETFTTKDVMAVLDLEEDNAARQQCQRWLVHGFIERVKKGKFKKIIKDIMA